MRLFRTTVASFPEREGFEPPEPRGSTVFKTASFDHSDTSPADVPAEQYRLYSLLPELSTKVAAAASGCPPEHAPSGVTAPYG
jgi:hypothetical protein